METLLQDPSGDLTDILLYHVIGATVLSTDLEDGQKAATLNGKEVTVSITDEGVFIDDAMVTVADITTDNGVVHVIDAVLLPSTSAVANLPLAVSNVFPNPAQSAFSFTMSEQPESNNTLVCYDHAGKIVMQWKNIRQSQELNIDQLESGYYLLKYQDEKFRSTTKLIKQ